MKVAIRKGSGPQTLTTGSVVIEFHVTLDEAHVIREVGVEGSLDEMLVDCLDEHFPTRLHVQRIRQTPYGHRRS
jgi:hypothetical protein